MFVTCAANNIANNRSLQDPQLSQIQHPRFASVKVGPTNRHLEKSRPKVWSKVSSEVSRGAARQQGAENMKKTECSEKSEVLTNQTVPRQMSLASFLTHVLVSGSSPSNPKETSDSYTVTANLSHAHAHSHSSHSHSINTTHDKKLVSMGLATALSIAIHNFPEGLATFVGEEQRGAKRQAEKAGLRDIDVRLLNFRT